MNRVSFIFTPYLAARMLGFASAAALFSALIAQYVFGHPPCILCLYERVPYALFLIFLILLRNRNQSLLFTLSSLVFALSTCLAFYHYGIEQLWWDPTTTCKVDLNGTTLEELEQAVLSKPLADCRQVTWSFLGSSMAFWNTLLSFILTLYSVATLRRLKI